jgi:Sperm-tail PG-rich repeat
MSIEGPSYTFRPRLKLKQGDLVPGPGNYTPNTNVLTKSSPAWGLGKSQKFMDNRKTKDVPGPGAYSTKTTLEGRKWGFGTSKRTQSVRANFPGPGSYEIKSTVGATPFYVQIPNKSL